ncbi:MAG: hypothetical protein H6993_18365 [Pseudomonadales bacterium]|nr:hypothetical protein [Pseudomonadales bacterium]
MDRLPQNLRVTVFPGDLSDYTYMIYTGLFELRDRGELVLDLRELRHGKLQVPHTVYLEVSEAGCARPVRVLFDLIDGEGLQAPAALPSVDVYFKRSLRARTFTGLDRGSAAKLLPFGLSYGVYSSRETPHDRSRLIWRSALRGPRRVSRVARLGRAVGARVLPRGRTGPRRSGQYLLSQLEGGARDKVSQVFFRTRIYAPGSMHDDSQREVINGSRVALIRVLRESFGSRFVGGLRNSAFARERYPDCLYDGEDNQDAHLFVGRESLIHVNTVGLHGSTGWKFPEALAQASCLVTEPCEDQLPSPLIDCEHYRVFRDFSTCVAACDELLTDRSKADAMRANGYAWYRQWARPDSALRRCLLQALDGVEDARKMS